MFLVSDEGASEGSPALCVIPLARRIAYELVLQVSDGAGGTSKQAVAVRVSPLPRLDSLIPSDTGHPSNLAGNTNGSTNDSASGKAPSGSVPGPTSNVDGGTEASTTPARDAAGTGSTDKQSSAGKSENTPAASGNRVSTAVPGDAAPGGQGLANSSATSTAPRRPNDWVDVEQRASGAGPSSASAFNEWLADALGTNARDAADAPSTADWGLGDASSRPTGESASLGLGRRVVDTQLQVVESNESADSERQAQSHRDSFIVTPEAIRTAGTMVTAGLVWWLTRSGGLLTSMLMGVPAWRHIDLLPVLAGQDEDNEQTPDERSLQLDAETQMAECESDERLADLFEREAKASNDLKEPS